MRAVALPHCTSTTTFPCACHGDLRIDLSLNGLYHRGSVFSHIIPANAFVNCSEVELMDLSTNGACPSVPPMVTAWVH